jgi:hypothetical protein
VTGDPFDYNSLDWEGGAALPSQDELNEWILANPGYSVRLELTKYEFRKLFTLNEKVAIDNCQTNATIPAQYKAILVSVMKDLELSAVIHLDNPDVAAGVNLLVSVGLLTAPRAAEILSNTPYTVV